MIELIPYVVLALTHRSSMKHLVHYRTLGTCWHYVTNQSVTCAEAMKAFDKFFIICTYCTKLVNIYRHNLSHFQTCPRAMSFFPRNTFFHRFAVFALGSSAYPNFCSFGKFLDNILGELGGERLMKIVLGDDLCGQEQEFHKWAYEVFKKSCETFCLDLSEMPEASLSLKSAAITKDNTRFQVVSENRLQPLSDLLSKYHNKTVHACRTKNKPINLHGQESSERSTVLVEICIDSVSKPMISNATTTWLHECN